MIDPYSDEELTTLSKLYRQRADAYNEQNWPKFAMCDNAIKEIRNERGRQGTA